MINPFNPFGPNAGKPKFGVGQLLFMVAWLGLFFGLINACFNKPPRQFGACSGIAVSESGKYAAVAYLRGIHLFRNGRFIDNLDVGQAGSIKFLDDEILAMVNVDGISVQGVSLYSLDQSKIVRSVSLDPKLSRSARLLDDKFIVHQFGPKNVGWFDVFDLNASAESKPLFSSPPSRSWNMPFVASNDGRHVAFHKHTGLPSDDFRISDAVGARYDLDVQTGKSNNLLQDSNSAAFSPDGSFIITCRFEIAKFSWPSAEKQWSIPCSELSARLRISRDGKKFAVVSGKDRVGEDRYLRIYDSNSANKIFEIKLKEDLGLGYALSADGQSVWTATQDENRGLTQWDIASNSIVKQFGSRGNTKDMVYYSALFFLWSVVYARLFPIRLNVQTNRIIFVIYALGSFLQLLFGCYIAFMTPSWSSIFIGSTQIYLGSIAAINAIRGLFPAKPKETEIGEAAESQQLAADLNG